MTSARPSLYRSPRFPSPAQLITRACARARERDRLGFRSEDLGGATWSRDVVLMRNAWVFHHTL